MGYARIDVADPAKLSAALSRGLGVRRSRRLLRITKKTSMPPEALLDVAIELLECVVGRLSPYPADSKPLPGLASGRWRTTPPAERSEILRRVAQARWADKDRRGP